MGRAYKEKNIFLGSFCILLYFGVFAYIPCKQQYNNLYEIKLTCYTRHENTHMVGFWYTKINDATYAWSADWDCLYYTTDICKSGVWPRKLELKGRGEKRIHVF